MPSHMVLCFTCTIVHCKSYQLLDSIKIKINTKHTFGLKFVKMWGGKCVKAISPFGRPCPPLSNQPKILGMYASTSTSFLLDFCICLPPPHPQCILQTGLNVSHCSSRTLHLNTACTVGYHNRCYGWLVVTPCKLVCSSKFKQQELLFLVQTCVLLRHE